MQGVQTMTHRRRHSDRADSMDLLLDTICNVFGGIIFIAILVAILTSDRTERVAEDARSALAAAQQQRRAVAMQDRIGELEAAIAQMEQTAEVIATPEGERRADVLERIEQQRRDARGRRDEARTWLETFEEATELRLDQFEAQLADEQQRLGELEAQLEAVMQQQTIEARLPYERRTARRQVLLLVHSERLFVVPLGLNEAALRSRGLDGHVRIRSIGGGLARGGGEAVTPRSGGGVALDGDFTGHDDVRRLFEIANPRRDFFDIYVTPDSFGAFQRLRRELARRGYRYNVEPYEGRRGEITFSPSGPRPVQ